MTENILFETNISNINPTTILKSGVRIDQSGVFILVPDTNVKLHDTIFNTNFLLSNCDGVISPTNIVTIYGKKINGKHINLDLKKSLMHSEDKTKSLKVIANIPNKIKDNLEKVHKYWFYDATYLSKTFEVLSNKYSSNKKICTLFYDHLIKLYNKCKTKNPVLNINIVFMLNSKSKMFDVLSNFYLFIPKDKFKTDALYDNYILFNNTKRVLFPLAYKHNGENKYIIKNFNKISSFMPEEKKELIISDEESEETINKIPGNKAKSIVKNLSSSKITLKSDSDDVEDDEHKTISIQIDSKKLSTILKKYNISDPDIIVNIKSFISTYIKEKGSTVSKLEAELIILKAVHYTLHGTDELRDEYITSPEKLFVKLKDFRNHRTPLNFPKIQELINPQDIVDLKYTTGTNRQKYEFEKSIHKNINKLFKVLEDRTEMPIKVKNIKHEVVDNDRSRFINYKITLENQTGDNKGNPYVVELQVPSPVNEKYFKIDNSTYIMANQQFFKPVTKTTENEVRILSNYGINTLGLQNLKFDISKIDKIIEYINIKYDGVIKESNESSYKFFDDSIIYVDGEDVYVDSKSKTHITFDHTTNNLKDLNSADKKIPQKRCEYLFTVILEKLELAGIEDKLTRTSKSIPYIYIRMGGIKLPLILYLWQNKGLLTTLNDLGIDYEFIQEDIVGEITVPTKGQFLLIKPSTKKQQFITNGLLFFNIDGVINDLDNPVDISEHIELNFGSGAISQIKNMTRNEIDPITKELLEFENLPTSLPNLLTEHCTDVLLNDKIDDFSDLKIYRSRLSELILNSMYKQITMAHNEYIRKSNFGMKTPQLAFDPNYIIRDIITEMGVLQHTEPTNPVDEIFLASRVIKTGEGGIPNKRSFKTEHRNIHKSQYGTMSANTTPESTNCGLIVSHTLTPSIINEYGSYTYKDIESLKGFNTLSINEALVPFQNQMDSDRLVMAATHSKQVIPTNGTEEALVKTGGEYIVPQITSNRFVIKAKQDGVIEEIEPNKYIKVKYKNNKIEYYHIGNRYSRTKMGQYLNIELNTLEKGSKVVKDQPIAFSKNFSKGGQYCSGKNMIIAMMNYDGYSHEDGYVISKNISEKVTRDIIKEVTIIIPPDTKILNLETKTNKSVSKKDVLVEFSYNNTIEDYLDNNNLLDDVTDDEFISIYNQGDNSIKLNALQGTLIDCKIYINNPRNTDQQIIKYHKQLVTDTKKLVRKLSNGDKSNISNLDNLSLAFMDTGNHKYKGDKFKGARIVYYIKQEVEMREGDKLAGRYGNKGVVSKIIDKDNVPYTKSNVPIDIFISPIGVFSRKNISMVKEIYLGKIMYYLNIKVKEMAKNNKISNDNIIKYILDIYKLIADSKIYKSIQNNLKNYKPAKLRKDINSGTFKLFYTVAPFTDVEFKNIKTAAEKLEIELDEYVYLPELKQWTKNKVPVGISYIQSLEQFSEIYSNVRSVGQYQSLTGQATKGKSRGGGQSLGNLDLYALLTYDCPSLLNEFFTVRSDNHVAKRKVTSDIIENGSAYMPENIPKGTTAKILDVFVIGMGLEKR
jgi:DNA-directed RNA polymerase beta subunit